MSILDVCFYFAMVASVGSNLLAKLERPEVRTIGARLEEEKAKRLLLQNDVEMMMVKLEKLERKCSQESDTLKTADDIPSTENEVISFTVRLSKRVDLDLNHVIIFDQVLHNQGEGYSSSTGIFKPPVPGTYVFILSLLSATKGKHFHVQIMKNSDEVGRLFAGDNTSTWPDHGSVTIVVHLEAADEVYTREFSTSASLHGAFYCTFSGFQL